jgi:hypothetical protein
VVEEESKTARTIVRMNVLTQHMVRIPSLHDAGTAALLHLSFMLARYTFGHFE